MMNDSIGIVCRPRRAWPPIARAAAAIISMSVLTLVAAACSGSPSSTGSGGSSNSQLLAFSRCMRSHGVPNFPDPNSSGELSKTTLQQLAASDSRFQPATQTCAHLLPNGGSGPTAAEVQQEWSGMLNFARCMHSHGVPDWPDPTPYPPRPNEPTFIVPASIQPIPPIISKVDECLRLVPHNSVVGHIGNPSWRSAQQAMAGS